MSSSSSSAVFQSLTLPNKQIINNRIIKAAMEESLGEVGQVPGERTFKLYETWAKGGSGALITGNVMVSDAAFTGPAGIYLDADTDIKSYTKWSQAVHQAAPDCKLWMQINHPGRQVFAAMHGDALAPSAIQLNLGQHSKFFAKPQAMTETHIEKVIEQFTATALQAQKAGFDGVQIHAAHGYLISQFLSPVSNQRDDQWGGSIENRARLLIKVVAAVTKAVAGSEFVVSVKINSADFQRGGFSEQDAEQVVLMLNDYNIDLLELSGGSYESPAMQGRTADGRTLEREAYFLTFAEKLGQAATMPVMTTGGIRRLATAEKVLAAGIDCAGVATALTINPNIVNQWQQGEQVVETPVVEWKDKAAASMATMAIIKRQLHRLASGKKAGKTLSPVWSLISDQMGRKKMTKRFNTWRVGR